MPITKQPLASKAPFSKKKNLFLLQYLITKLNYTRIKNSRYLVTIEILFFKIKYHTSIFSIYEKLIPKRLYGHKFDSFQT